MKRATKDSIRLPFQHALDFHERQSEKVHQHQIPIDTTFPEEAANKLAALESYNKHLFRPNSYLHKWWARRSGTTFRHILKQLVASPAGKRDYYVGGGLEGKVILDPMMGGGTILHEAIRMGANVVGFDIDPIPVLQAKASLAQSSLHHKQKVFEEYLETLKQRLAPFYRTCCPICENDSEIQFLLYGLRRKCACREVIFLDNLLLRKSNKKDVHICPRCSSVYTGEIHNCLGECSRQLMVKGTRSCEKCEGSFTDILDVPFNKRYVPLVIVGSCSKHGMFFKSPDRDDLQLIKAAVTAQKIEFGNPNEFQVHQGPKSKDLLRRGISNFQDLFTPRQLIYLATSMDFLSKLSQEDRLWLALLVSTSLEFNSLLCGYKGSDIRRPGAIRHVFSHHAYSFPYTALENNPIFSGNTSGTLNRLFHERVKRASQWAVEPVEIFIADNRRIKASIRGEIDAGEAVSDWKSLREGKRRFFIMQGDASIIHFPEGMADYVVTDPPYYDNVQYSDLSNFFRVWLRRFLPFEADWDFDRLHSAVSEGDPFAGQKYGDVLGNIWRNCLKALNKDHGRLIFTFHHWSSDAWAELTLSLKRAGFTLVNRYIVFSENPISVHIMGLKSLKHDTILVLRPKMTEAEFAKWAKPSHIERKSSETFCRDCGTALGWFLQSDMIESNIRSEWKRLIGVNTNDKASG